MGEVAEGIETCGAVVFCPLESEPQPAASATTTVTSSADAIALSLAGFTFAELYPVRACISLTKRGI
jgi:hypothetical protein